MEGGRRGLILPGLWDKLVSGSRKRYAGQRRRKSCYPSILLSIQEHVCDREPHGFVLDVCEVSRNVCLRPAWPHGCSGIGQKWRQKFYNRRLRALFPDSKGGGKDEGGEETGLRAAGEWQDLAATPGVQH